MSSTPIFDAAGTARLIPFRALVDALKTAAADYAAGRVVSPERLVVPLNDNGIMLDARRGIRSRDTQTRQRLSA